MCPYIFSGLRLTMSQRALDEMNLVDPRGPSTVWEHWEANKDPNTRTVLDDLDLEGRLNYFNSTNAATWVTIGAVAVLLVAVMLYLYDFYATARSDTVPQYGPYGEKTNYGSQYYNKRSAPEGMNVMNVIQWISMLQEVYEKFDYNDLECQKKLICEVMREPEYFGNMSAKLKSGFQMARYLEVLNMPDDFRELLDEYLDASERSEGQKACEEFFQCPYSIKDSVKRNFSGNSL